jgi:glutamine phosphoribosylpyrophosphate amidotransferase
MIRFDTFIFDYDTKNIIAFRQKFNLTTLKFKRLDDLVEAIGLPKEKLCPHCWDNSSYS